MAEKSALQKEIRQGRPFQSRWQEAALGLLRTADVVRRFLSGVIEPHGITFQQYNVLRILRGAGKDGCPTLEVADRMIERAPGITRLLDRLEAKGLARRERCPHDRRQVLCYVTPAGLGLLGTLERPLQEADQGVLMMLGEAQLGRLIGLLDAIRAGHR